MSVVFYNVGGHATSLTLYTTYLPVLLKFISLSQSFPPSPHAPEDLNIKILMVAGCFLYFVVSLLGVKPESESE